MPDGTDELIASSQLTGTLKLLRAVGWPDLEGDAFLRLAQEQLTDREWEVIQRRFDLNGRGWHSLQLAGAMLGMSSERVRQVQQTALAKLRRAVDVRDEHGCR